MPEQDAVTTARLVEDDGCAARRPRRGGRRSCPGLETLLETGHPPPEPEPAG